MADDRYWQSQNYRVTFEEGDRRPVRAFAQAIHNDASAQMHTYRELNVRIPANQTKVVKLDDAIRDSTDWDLKFIELKADRYTRTDDVLWWPIDQPGQEAFADPQTSRIGWVVNEHRVFTHTHGGDSFNEHVGGLTPAYDMLPTWQNFAEDAAAAPPFDDQSHLIIDDSPGPLLPPASPVLQGPVHDEPLVGYKGKALQLPMAGPVGIPQKNTAIYMLGMDNYMNLGTDYDGLGLFIVYNMPQSADYAVGDNPQIRLINWPFTSELLEKEDLPAHPFGAPGYWHPLDPMIDRKVDASPWAGPIDTIGWDGSATVKMAAVFLSPTGGLEGNADLKEDGWIALPRYKRLRFNTDSTVTGMPGTGTLSRVTGIVVRFRMGTPDLTLKTHVANLWFGPRVMPCGSARHLRPYEYVTGPGLWSLDPVSIDYSKHFIGLQNQMNEAAEVRIRYGIRNDTQFDE